MSNNSRLCPNCRSPFPSHTCKKCGYKQKTLKVVDIQQSFVRVNYLNKIQRVRQKRTELRDSEKLTIYLKQYQKLIKNAAQRIIEVNQLNLSVGQQLKSQIKFIWHSYLCKKKEICSPISGIFKKYLTRNKQNDSLKLLKEQEIKEAKDQQQIKQILKQQQQENSGKKKRGRPAKSNSMQHKQSSLLTKLRCFITISVKPLIFDSIQQRKTDKKQLTSAQKLFLSFLLGVKQADEQFLLSSSYKYLKLILAIDGNKIEKSFIKQNLINLQLRKRDCKRQETRQKSILLIMLYDLLLCYRITNQNIDGQIIANLQQLIEEYEFNNIRNDSIEMCLQSLRNQKVQQDPNIPQISYQLVYAIIYIASVRIGLTLSVGQIILECGPLQIKTIQIDQQIFLPAIVNQEAISSQKTRRTSHILSYFLGLQFQFVTSKWCRKWCKKLQIFAFLPMFQLLNKMILDKIKNKGAKKVKSREEMMYQRQHAYYRYYELEQDIASLAGIVIFLKLADGLTDYPYLVLFQTQLINKYYTISSEVLDILRKLLINKQANVEGVSKTVTTKVIPHQYHNPLDIMTLARKLSNINYNDKQFGAKMFNWQIIKLRNLSHLNKIPSLQLIQSFTRMKQARLVNDSDNQIRLRYNQTPHLQWIDQNLKRKKIKGRRISKEDGRLQVQLSDNIVNQLNCILGNQEKIVQQKGSTVAVCLVDEPSSNYQLMYEYGGENLMLVNRSQQLFMMQQLCLNVCTYSEMVGWINNYESVLKQFQTK